MQRVFSAKTCFDKTGLALPEGVLLIAFPVIILLVFGLTGHLRAGLLTPGFWKNAIYYLFFGWQFFFPAFVVLFGYKWFRYMRPRRRPERASAPTSHTTELRSLLFLTLAFFITLVINIAAMDAVYQPEAARVVWASEHLMRVDHAVFGAYPSFVMQTSTLFRALSFPMLVSYVNMSSILSVVFLGLLLFRPKLFREYVLAFFVIMFISIPFWMVLPAISPSEMYRSNVIGSDIPSDIQVATAPGLSSIDPSVIEFVNAIEPGLSDHAIGRYAVSTFPSMHLAWGTLMMYYGVILFWPLAFLVIPWNIFNGLGAIYTFQHYAIDIPAGVLVTVAAVAIVRWLIALEARLGMEPPKAYALIGSLSEDAKAAWRRWRFTDRSLL